MVGVGLVDGWRWVGYGLHMSLDALTWTSSSAQFWMYSVHYAMINLQCSGNINTKEWPVLGNSPARLVCVDFYGSCIVAFGIDSDAVCAEQEPLAQTTAVTMWFTTVSSRTKPGIIRDEPGLNHNKIRIKPSLKQCCKVSTKSEPALNQI